LCPTLPERLGGLIWAEPTPRVTERHIGALCCTERMLHRRKLALFSRKKNRRFASDSLDVIHDPSSMIDGRASDMLDRCLTFGAASVLCARLELARDLPMKRSLGVTEER
jgi:hypothetical protein